MNGAQLLNTIIGGVAVLLLAGIGRAMLGIRNDFRRFMAEHMWLITTTLWTRDKVLVIMRKLDLPIEQPPPSDLGSKEK